MVRNRERRLEGQSCFLWEWCGVGRMWKGKDVVNWRVNCGVSGANMVCTNGRD